MWPLRNHLDGFDENTDDCNVTPLSMASSTGIANSAFGTSQPSWYSAHTQPCLNTTHGTRCCWLSMTCERWNSTIGPFWPKLVM